MAKTGDYGWVTNRIAVGGQITSLYDVRRMEADGITNILNVRTSQDEVPFVQKVGLVYASNPTNDHDSKTKPSEWFRSSSEIILSAIQAPGSRILVHCERGEDRGPSTVYFFLRTLGLKKDTCEQLITEARPQAKGNMRFNDDAEAALKELGYKD